MLEELHEELHEECGVIGIYNGDNVARNVAMGLYALQHRGQESAGFAVSDGDKVRVRKSMGLVSTLLRDYNIDEFRRVLFRSARPEPRPSRTLSRF